MSRACPQRLKVGVVGLGRLWEARHKPAFQRLADQFRVVAVYDQVHRRAEFEARSLGAVAAESLTQLIERSDIDIISILAPQWFGLHAVELACRAGKSIYCALPLATEIDEVNSLTELVTSKDIRFMPELARRFYPATLRLKELLANTIGPARLVLGTARVMGFDRYSQPGPTTQVSPASLLIDPGSYLIDWCRFIFDDEPSSVQACGTLAVPSSQAGNDFEGFVAEFPGGRLAQINVCRFHRKVWGEAVRFLPQPGFQVYAERGTAWIELPDKVQWSDASGIHSEQLALEPSVGELLNQELYRFVQGEPSLAPTWNDARQVVQLVANLTESHREGRKVRTRPAHS